MKHQIKTIFQLIITTSLALSLAACSTVSMPTKSYHKLSWSERIAQLKKLDQWSAHGSFSIRYAKNNDVASYQWHQEQDTYKISISSPLNLVHADLYGNKQQITLQKSAYKLYTANSPETLLKQQTGLSLPISNLLYWIKGMPSPQHPAQIKLDDYKHLLTLKQQGWTVHYLDFTNIDDIDLPSKISMENAQLKIKMVIKNWQVTSRITINKKGIKNVL